jgi:hypothetical protein
MGPAPFVKVKALNTFLSDSVGAPFGAICVRTWRSLLIVAATLAGGAGIRGFFCRPAQGRGCNATPVSCSGGTQVRSDGQRPPLISPQAQALAAGSTVSFPTICALDADGGASKLRPSKPCPAGYQLRHLKIASD